MARQLRLEIEGDARDARKALDSVADEAEKTARATEVLGSEFKKAAKESGWLEKNLKDVAGDAAKAGNSIYVLGKRSDKAADELRDAARAAAQLDSQLSSTRVELDRLNKSFAESGDPEVLKSIQKQYAELDKISRVKKRIQKDDADAVKKAEEAAKRAKSAFDAQSLIDRRNKRGILRNTLGDLFGLGIGGVKAGASGLADATSKIPGGKIALGVVGAGAVPAAGALGGAALLGGAGLAGIGAGIAGAVANNPEPFRQAWTAAIQDISIKWQKSSSDFEKPTLEAIQILRNAVMDIDLAGPFKEASKYVQPLASGIGALVKDVGDGLGILVKGSGPVLKTLAQDIPKIGLAFKKMSSDIAGSSEGAGEALHDLIDFTAVSVIAVGKLISKLSDFYSAGNRVYDGIIDANAKITGIKLFGGTDQQVMTYARALDSAKRSTFDMAAAQKEMGDAARKASEEYDRQLNLLLGLEGAQDNATIALQNLKEGFKENGAALQGNSAAALENRDNLRQVQLAYEDVRLKAIEAAGDSQEAIRAANQEYVKHLEEVREILRAHGQSTAALDEYIRKFKEMNGLTATQYIRVIYYEEGPSKGLPKNLGGRYGGSDNHAGGGTMLTSGPKKVGEQGPELIWGSKGQFVSTAAETRRLMSTWATMANGGGASTSGGPSEMRLVSGGDTATAQLIAFLVDRGLLQFFDINGNQIKVRR